MSKQFSDLKNKFEYLGKPMPIEFKDICKLDKFFNKIAGRKENPPRYFNMVSDFLKFEYGGDLPNTVYAAAKKVKLPDYICDLFYMNEEGYKLVHPKEYADFFENQPQDEQELIFCAADYGAPQKRMRFVVMGVKRSISPKVALPKGIYDEDEYLTVRDAISDLEEIKPFVELNEDLGIPITPHGASSELGRKLRDSRVLYNHIITNTTETAMQRFRVLKQGENFHALDEKLKANTYTDSSRTQNTIYLRLNYDEPSGTVVNVRKSMWIHPAKDRAVSVREAARLQTFPDSFVFCGSKDKQYQQVGNAVPPILAKAIAVKLASVLDRA